MVRSLPLRIALVNDVPIVVDGLRTMLAPYVDRVVVVEAVTGPISAIQRDGRVRRADVALLDGFGVEDLTQRVTEILRELSTRVVVFSWTFDPSTIQAAAAAGAQGYLSKALGAAALVAALERVHDGEFLQPPARRTPTTIDGAGDWPGRSIGLNERESEIVLLISRGLNNDDIARRMFLSINSIKRYIRSAYSKMGVDSRTEAVLWAIDNGFRADLFRSFDRDS